MWVTSVHRLSHFGGIVYRKIYSELQLTEIQMSVFSWDPCSSTESDFFSFHLFLLQVKALLALYIINIYKMDLNHPTLKNDQVLP